MLDSSTPVFSNYLTNIDRKSTLVEGYYTGMVIQQYSRSYTTHGAILHINYIEYLGKQN